MLFPLPDTHIIAISIPVWDQYVQLLTWSLDYLANLLHSGGLAIIAFTIIIKTLILPLTVKSTRSSKAMQELQPKIKELQKKHGKDRQRLTQETMALYQQYQVNPMAGCLPMLIQIPIFLGLYNAILHLSQEGAGYWDQPFLWIPNLAQPDPLHILPFIAAGFQFVQTKMMRPAGQGKISDPQQAMMNSVMNFMPLTVIFFGWNFAAGPVLYWATQSIYSVVQQWLITGWGAMKDWFPGLPEMAEHRRLGYRPPRDLSDVVVLAGEGGAPVTAKRGIGGWLQTQMERANAQMAVQGAAPAKDEPVDAETGPAKTNGKNASGKAKGKNGAAPAPAPATSGSGDGSKAVIVQRKQPPSTNGSSGQGQAS